MRQTRRLNKFNITIYIIDTFDKKKTKVVFVIYINIDSTFLRQLKSVF